MPPPVLDGICDASYSHHFYLEILHEKVLENSCQNIVEVIEGERIWSEASRTRFLEIHDSPRVVEIAPGSGKPLLVLMATVPGIPMLQAGQEIGATTRYGPDLEVNWQRGDTELRDFYKKVIEIRNRSDVFKFGSIENVRRSGDEICAFIRGYQDEQVVVLINFRMRAATSRLIIAVDSGDALLDILNGERFEVDDLGIFHISTPGNGSRILVVTDGS